MTSLSKYQRPPAEDRIRRVYVVSEPLLKRIREYGQTCGLPSETAAVKDLLEKALAAIEAGKRKEPAHD